MNSEEHDDTDSDKVTVDEFIANIMKKKTLLGGRMRSLSRPIHKQTDHKIENSEIKESGLIASGLTKQKIGLQIDHRNLSLSSSKLTRSVSTPEMNAKFNYFHTSVKSKPNASRKVDFVLNQPGLYPTVDTNIKQCTVSNMKLPDQESSLRLLRNCESSVDNHHTDDVTGGMSQRSRSSSLVNINHHKTSDTKNFKLNMPDTVTTNKLDSDIRANVKERSPHIFRKKENTGPSVPSSRSLRELVRERIESVEKQSNDRISTPESFPGQGVISLNQPSKPSPIETLHSASPKKSVLFSNSDIINVKGKTYLYIGKLGKGGSSCVYEVLDLNSRQRRAIKIVDLKDDSDMRASYINEIKILQRLQYHPRVIKLFDYEETETQLKLIMEAGSIDLATIINEARTTERPISAVSVKHYWQEMLLAVQTIHSEGIIHLDLKPANFLLVSGSLKLIDFGISSSLQQDMTSIITDSQGGTFNYMSPESINDVDTQPIYKGKSSEKPQIKVGVKSDIWSLGCILYNLVYGHTPFHHLLQPYKKLAAISNPNTQISYPPLSDKNLLDVLQRCLQFTPQKRPSIQELLHHQYLDG